MYMTEMEVRHTKDTIKSYLDMVKDIEGQPDHHLSYLIGKMELMKDYIDDLSKAMRYEIKRQQGGK